VPVTPDPAGRGHESLHLCWRQVFTSPALTVGDTPRRCFPVSEGWSLTLGGA